MIDLNAILSPPLGSTTVLSCAKKNVHSHLSNNNHFLTLKDAPEFLNPRADRLCCNLGNFQR